MSAPDPTEPQVVYPFATLPEVVSEQPSRPRTARYLVAAALALVVLAGAGLAAFWLRPVSHAGRTTPAAGAAASPSAADAAVPAPVPSTGPSPSVSASAPAAPSRSASASPAAPADPNLVAQDDFSGTALDTNRWHVYGSTAANGSVWTPSMISVAGGELRIAGVGHNPSGAGNASGGLCWCGPLGDRVYGRWMVRARFDAGAGYGPVMGLWPRSDNADAQGAIGFGDCLLADRTTVDGYVTGPAGNPTFYDHSVGGDCTAWHVYTVEWRPTYVRMSVDGTVYYDSSVRPGLVPPSAPMHLYLQQIVGPGDGVGAPDAHTPASVTMHIDWVRLYR